ncbi:hypothetical protein AAFF_G00375050 [Aldrovandia affinis]|uniref:Uncharacterized protein n=1 Tax=Aldrovandia affinis TaxID=143900 RepID=A0AAD7WMW9_9TELE|nr:hypothetical protein AAFF_G00375050 [Aldrovandia affinis]
MPLEEALTKRPNSKAEKRQAVIHRRRKERRLRKSCRGGTHTHDPEAPQGHGQLQSRQRLETGRGVEVCCRQVGQYDLRAHAPGVTSCTKVREGRARS